MKKVVLVRHGESQWNKENRFTGWTAPPRFTSLAAVVEAVELAARIDYSN